MKKKKISFWMRIHLDSIFVLLLMLIMIYSLYILWSASGQNIAMMNHKIIQIGLGFMVLAVVAQFPPRLYQKWAFTIYLLCIAILILVELFGYTSKGATRWLHLGFIRIQPSEIAKLAVPLMVATYINKEGMPPTFKTIMYSLLIIMIPTLLIAKQPDLGTAILVAASGFFILFLAGIYWRYILIALGFLAALIPTMWFYLMHDYQRERVLTLFDPYRDPTGKGYHIIQSKTAIGSGGLFGKGWLNGTQSQLEFIPERHTDFIFSVIAEEHGFLGLLFLLLLFLLLLARGLFIAAEAQTIFGRLLVGGQLFVLFIYIFINIGMVSGILPVVGVPLPLVSYGGTSLVVLMAGFGMIMSIHTHRNILSKQI